jgi:hypothetical protein
VIYRLQEGKEGAADEERAKIESAGCQDAEAEG